MKNKYTFCYTTCLQIIKYKLILFILYVGKGHNIILLRIL